MPRVSKVQWNILYIAHLKRLHLLCYFSDCLAEYACKDTLSISGMTQKATEVLPIITDCDSNIIWTGWSVEKMGGE